MWSSRSLHQKVALAIIATVVFFCGAFALLVALFNMQIEDEFLYQDMARELNEYRVLHRMDPQVLPPATSNLDSYLVDDADSDVLPAPLRGLSTGQHHEVVIGARNYHVGVAKLDDKTLILAEDITSSERRETWLDYLLVVGFVLASAAAFGVGHWAARVIVGPVDRLAQQVRALPPEQRNVVFPTDEFEGHEVRILAQAFESYAARLDAFIARERIFTEDVSHELRTPLTVLHNAVEILIQSGPKSEREARTIERMRRTLTRMDNLIAALLFLAREPTRDEETLRADLAETVEAVVASHQPSFESRGVILERDIDDAGYQLAAPAAAVEIVVGNLLRNAFEHGNHGRVVIRLLGQELSVTDSGPGIPFEQQDMLFERGQRGTASHGSGLGLYLVRRVCDRYNWSLQLTSAPTAGTSFRVGFV